MAENARREYETPRVMHDAPLRDDDAAYFHFDDFARTLARLIASKETRTPLTIGVSGSWGAGKTTLLKRTCRMLEPTAKLSDVTQPAQLEFAGKDEYPPDVFRVCRPVWFDAWKYGEEDELLVALVRVILNEMSRGDLGEKFWSKVLDPQRPRYNVLATFLNMFKLKFGGVEVGVDLEKYKTETPFVSHTAFFDFFDQAFETLLARWVHSQSDYDKIDEQRGVMVVFVDDLDRCLPKKTVQVLEAIKLFLDKPGCVFVLGADADIVRDAVASHYKDVGVTGESAREYLEKIIQLRFELPPIQRTDMGRYIESEQDTMDAEVRRNWETIVVGADVNPRKVKTFVNDINLRWAMFKNSGQAPGVNRDDFTRWQVLMRAAPTGFIKQLDNFPDDAAGWELRRKFIDDALKWARDQAEPSAAAVFEQYSNLRLKRVLRQITFTDEFTPKVLDAFVHLTAPPAPTPEVAVAEQVQVPEAAKAIRAREPGREAAPQMFGGIEFLRVPAGKFVMGSKDDNPQAYDDEKPQHTVEISYDYWIARYPVTNDQFAAFVRATKYEHKPAKDWKDKSDHPVVNVSWHDAVAYCKWLDETLRGEIRDPALAVRLPTEAEWEKAARGEYGNEWPWGNEFDAARCNSIEGGKHGTTSVGAYSPQGDSPYGAADMAGNVWEWCHSVYRAYPYKADDGREKQSGSGFWVLRGGTYGEIGRIARCAYRDRYVPDLRSDGVGFRVVVAASL